MRTHSRTRMHAFCPVRAHSGSPTHTCTRTHALTPAPAHIHAHTHACTYLHPHAHTSTRTRTHALAPTYVHTRMHAHKTGHHDYWVELMSQQPHAHPRTDTQVHLCVLNRHFSNCNPSSYVLTSVLSPPRCRQPPARAHALLRTPMPTCTNARPYPRARPCTAPTPSSTQLPHNCSSPAPPGLLLLPRFHRLPVRCRQGTAGSGAPPLAQNARQHPPMLYFRALLPCFTSMLDFPTTPSPMRQGLLWPP